MNRDKLGRITRLEHIDMHMGNWSLIYSGKNRRAEHNRWRTWNTWGKGWGISQGLERTHHMILCKLRAGSVGQ